METLLVLATAVLTASVLGSMHCVGMCGPLAIWASGGGERTSRMAHVRATFLYHVGRLATYSLAGCLAGLIGSAVDHGGSMIGVQVAAARVVGIAMVGLGVWKLWGIFRRRESIAGQPAPAVTTSPKGVTAVLVKLRPYIFRLPLPGRAFVTGLLTTLLPCGWLYLFALIAAGTGSPLSGAVVMAAFWLGSVPALVGLVAGVRVLGQRYTRLIPAAAAVMLIFAGCFTASGRGFDGFDSLDELASDGSSLEQVEQAGEKTLPCCEVDAKP